MAAIAKEQQEHRKANPELYEPVYKLTLAPIDKPVPKPKELDVEDDAWWQKMLKNLRRDK
jgi:hypothetical protein